MRYPLSILAAVVTTLGLIGVTTVEAHPPGHSGHGHMSHGYSGHGGSWNRHKRIHYTERRWFERCHCYCYFCPEDSCWYYWSEPDGSYYPMNSSVSGLPTGGPAPKTTVGSTGPNRTIANTEKTNPPDDDGGSSPPPTSQPGGDGGM